MYTESANGVRKFTVRTCFDEHSLLATREVAGITGREK